MHGSYVINLSLFGEDVLGFAQVICVTALGKRSEATYMKCMFVEWWKVTFERFCVCI